MQRDEVGLSFLRTCANWIVLPVFESQTTKNEHYFEYPFKYLYEYLPLYYYTILVQLYLVTILLFKKSIYYFGGEGGSYF